MTALAESYELIGRILAKLVLGGLRRQDITAEDVIEVVTDEKRHHFIDVCEWLRVEGLMTITSVFVNGLYADAQLTSKGVAAVEKGTFNGPAPSIRETVESKPDGSLGSDTYGKIGAFVGGLLGGFTQSAS